MAVLLRRKGDAAAANKQGATAADLATDAALKQTLETAVVEAVQQQGVGRARTSHTELYGCTQRRGRPKPPSARRHGRLGSMGASGCENVTRMVGRMSRRGTKTPGVG